jgi:hypothetical protein
VENRDGDYKTGVAANVKEELEHAGEIATLGYMLGLLLDEQGKTIGQLFRLVTDKG